MDWTKLTLSQIRRLVAAIEQASDGREVIPSIVERVPDEPMPHSRVTLESLINLLEQLGGCTVLSEEMLTVIKQLDEPPTANTPEITTTVDGNSESELIVAPLTIFVNGAITLAAQRRAGMYEIEIDEEEYIRQCLDNGIPDNKEMGLISFASDISSGWVMENIKAKWPEWRVATARELLAFGIVYPDHEYPIIALGTDIIKHGHRMVLSFNGRNQKLAKLVAWDGNWSSVICRFLVVKKTVAQPTNEVTFDSLVAACQFSSVDMDFTARRFLLVDDRTTGQVDEILLRGMTVDEAITEIRLRGYEPVGVRRGLEYIAANLRLLQAEPRRIVIAGVRWLGYSPVRNLDGSLVMHKVDETYHGGSCYLVARPA